MIKTLHLTNAWHGASGGIRTWYRAAIDGANRVGRELRLVVPAAEARTERIGGFVRVYHLRAPRAPLDRRYRLLFPTRYLLPAGSIRRILADERPDLIEVCDKYTLNWLAGLIRKGFVPEVGRPALVGMSCERMDDNVAAFLSDRSMAMRLAALYCRYCYVPLFDFHVAASSYVAEELQGAMTEKHRRTVRVATPGVDAARFSPTLRSEALRLHYLRLCGANEHGVLVLYCGRLSPEKNLGILVDAVERLRADPAHRDRPYCLVLAGDGPLSWWIRTEVKARTAGRIQLIGHLEDRDVLARLYASCDVFAHPNSREPFGIGPLEAMASGCPVVLPDSGGVLTYANDGNAWLAPGSAEPFARAIRSASVDTPDRRARTARARETALRFGWPDAIGRAFDLYDAFHDEFHSRCGTTPRRESVSGVRPIGAARPSHPGRESASPVAATRN